MMVDEEMVYDPGGSVSENVVFVDCRMTCLLATPLFQARFDFFTYAAKTRQPGEFIALGGGGIIEAPMKMFSATGENRAMLLRVVAYGNDKVEGLPQINIELLAGGAMGIDSHFVQYPDGHRVDTGRRGTR